MLPEFKPTPDTTRKEIDYQGTTWIYYRLGAGNTAVILFPGGMRRPVYGDDFVKTLANHFVVLIPVYPPTGSLDLLAGCTAAMIREEGFGKAHLHGSSFGGIMVQVFYALYPSMTGKMVLANTGTVSEDSAVISSLKLNRFFLKIMPSFIVNKIIRKTFTGIIPEEVPNKNDIINTVNELIAGGYLGKREMLCHFESLLQFHQKIHPSPDWIEKDKPPMLIITADNDKGVREGADKELKRRYPHAQFYHFTEGGHMPMLIKPDKFISTIVEFLRGKP